MSKTKRETILLIEDNPDLRTATLDLLETLGYDVLVAADVLHALETVRGGSVDLALVNAYPGDGTGLDTVDALRAAAPSLPALLASGFGDDLELRRRVLTRDVGFLQIPFSSKDLDEKIIEALEQTPGRSVGAPVGPSHSARAQDETGGSRRTYAYLAAALAIVAAGLGFQLVDPAPRMPAPDSTATRRGRTIELVAPVGALAAPPTRLTWRQAPGSARYRVVLSTVDDTTIWQSETRGTTIDLPGRVSKQLHSAVSYFWQVEGLAEDSSRTGKSILVAFRFGVSGPDVTGG